MHICSNKVAKCLTSSPRCTRSERPPTKSNYYSQVYRCGYLRLSHRPRRSMRSSSRTACRAASSIIAQALDRCRRPRRPLALSCFSVHSMAAADTKTMYTVSPCVDANTRRGGTAVDEARDERTVVNFRDRLPCSSRRNRHKGTECVILIKKLLCII